MRDEKSLKKAKPRAKKKVEGAKPSSSLIPHPSSLVAVIMGSTSDWETMRHAAEVLKRFGVPHECLVVSAHRTPKWLAEFASEAEARGLDAEAWQRRGVASDNEVTVRALAYIIAGHEAHHVQVLRTRYL